MMQRLPRAALGALAAGALTLSAAAQIYDYPGPSPNIPAPAVDFDAPGVPLGPLPAGFFAGTGITSVAQFGNGWGVAGTSTYLGGYGRLLASKHGASTVVGALESIDRAGYGDGWQIVLDQPVDELQIAFNDNFIFHDVELFLGATSLGVGAFGSIYQARVRYYRAAAGPFDRARLTLRTTLALGIDELGFGSGPPPPPPANDECATRLAVGQGATSFSTRSSTPSSEPWTCAGAGSGDIWFEYTAVTSGYDLELCLDLLEFQPMCEVYTGPCGSLSLADCRFGRCSSSPLRFPGVVAGTTYTIRIGAQTPIPGTGRLRITEHLSGPPATADCLQTYFAADNGTADGGALYFDLVVNEDIESAGLELNTSSTGPLGLEVYVIPGSYVGQAGNPGGAGWTLAAIDDGNAVGLGHDQRTPIQFAAPWRLTEGTWGVALVGHNAATGARLRHDFSNGTPFNQVFASADGIVRYQAGAADDTPWSGGLSAPAVWNGHMCHVRTTLGSSYCTANANSTGLPGVITASGSAVALQNDLRLHGVTLPFNAFCYFIASRDQGFVPHAGGSQGNLCLGGAIGRFVGPGQIKNTGAQGRVALDVDSTRHPTPTGLVSVSVGETWYYSLWFRESVGGSATSNFTNGLQLSFE